MHTSATNATVPALELLEVGFATPAPSTADAPSPRPRWPFLAATVLTLMLIAALAFVAFRTRTTEEEVLAAPVAVTTAPDGMAGFAEMYVAAYLTAGAGRDHDPIAAFYPAAPPPTEHGADRFVRHVATLGASSPTDGVWELRLAADVLVHDGVGYREDGIHHYLVGVLDTAQGFTATSLPVRIPAPSPAPIAATGAGAAVEDPGLLALIDAFLAAYLTGTGDVRTFTTGDAAIVSITPPPFHTVRVDSVAADAVAPHPAGLRVVATGMDGVAEQRLEYHLRIVDLGGALAIERIGAMP